MLLEWGIPCIHGVCEWHAVCVSYSFFSCSWSPRKEFTRHRHTQRDTHAHTEEVTCLHLSCHIIENDEKHTNMWNENDHWTGKFVHVNIRTLMATCTRVTSETSDLYTHRQLSWVELHRQTKHLHSKLFHRLPWPASSSSAEERVALARNFIQKEREREREEEKYVNPSVWPVDLDNWSLEPLFVLSTPSPAEHIIVTFILFSPATWGRMKGISAAAAAASSSSPCKM